MQDVFEPVEFSVVQGADLKISLVVSDDAGTPINITGASVKMQVRQNYGTSSILAESSTALGDITIVGASGQINIAMPGSKTGALPVSDYVGDVFLTYASGSIDCVLRVSPLHVLARVTQ